MRVSFCVFSVLLFFSNISFSKDLLALYFKQLSNLEFEEAKRTADYENDSLLRFEMKRMAGILYYEGQIDKSNFKAGDTLEASSHNTLYVFRALSLGYLSLFYEPVKGNAYKYFYSAYHSAKEVGNNNLIKASLLALLKYYNYEIAQNSEAHRPYLIHFETLRSNLADSVWVDIYKMIFLSKTFVPLRNEYFSIVNKLNEHERKLTLTSPLRVHLYYEKALKLELESDLTSAKCYYQKTFQHARSYPFLRNHRFFSSIKLMRIQTNQGNFDSARIFFSNARKEVDTADTLRSIYYLNLYGAFLMKAEGRSDSAFSMLWDAYKKEFLLDFRRNTLEINRLNIELDTQEKENANLRLRQGRTWLVTAVVGFALLAAASYFAYTNQLTKNKIQQKDKEVQSMKLDKLLKEQELMGIDAMIEGQEKERQRLAEELHDHLGSLLTSLKFHFGSLKSKHTHQDDREDVIQKTDALLEEAYQKVRTIAHVRHVGMNPSDGLLAAIHSYAVKASVLNRLKIDVEEHGITEGMDAALEMLLFRMVQELIANVIKHADASEVVVHLTKHDQNINLMVEDNGKGFELSQIKPGETMGLYAIQKKIESLGGTVSIDSLLGKGTSIIIDIPLS